MNKKIVLNLLLFLTLSFGMAFSKIIVDQRGVEVILKDKIERIVTLPMPSPSLLFSVDLSGNRIVGMHPTSMTAVRESILSEIAPELLSVSTEFVKSGFETNVEEVLKLKPDVVLQWCNRGEEIITPLVNSGIPVIGLKYGNQEDLETWLTIFGKLLDNEKQSQNIIDFHRKSIKEMQNLTMGIPQDKKPRILYLPYGSQLYTTGKETYNDFYFNLTGAVNLAGELTGWKIVTMEQILVWNPDIIYIGNFTDEMPEDYTDNSFEGQDWSSIKAVKEGRIYKVPLGVYRWDPPSQESPLMWKWLFKIQHPELADYDLNKSTVEFYEDFYNYSLNSDQLSKIMQEK